MVFGPSERLDIELEVGTVIGVPSEPGRPVPVDEAMGHVFGLVLVNDWSARDIQAWEYQPLGPFLGKSFATTMSAWVTPLDALGPCRTTGPVQDPAPLPYLRATEDWALDLGLSVDLRPAGAASAETVSTTTFAGLYWRIPQQIAHLTVNGAHLRTGDLLASGTVSGATTGQRGQPDRADARRGRAAGGGRCHPHVPRGRRRGRAPRHGRGRRRCGADARRGGRPHRARPLGRR